MSPHAMNTIAPDKPLSREEAAEYLGLSPITLQCWAAQGAGPTYSRSGEKRGRVWYRRADLDRWIESRSIKPSK
jgi:hypothetical protein